MTYLLILIAVLFVADSVSTVYILRHGGRELNPVVSWLIGRLGVRWAMAGCKVVAFGALVWWRHTVPVEAVLVLIAAYVFVVASNVGIVLKMRDAR